MTHHDVVVIGGSLAGAACVRELARLGIDAIALERDKFPRAKVCGGFLSPGTVRCLEEFGLLAEVRTAGAVEISSARVSIGGHQIEIPFQRPGLGISRTTLDDVVARGARVVQGCPVREVKREGDGFRVDDLACSVVIDASGKLSRFTKRQAVEEFGIQYFGSRACGNVLEFSFFEDGYGGTVSIEGGGSNSCFLIKKDALGRYIGRRDCLVSGPLAYDRIPGEFIAIGDAAGMVDPFCGEGMRHALETGMLAARVVARALPDCASYRRIKAEYESAYEGRWRYRRRFGAMIRRLVSHRSAFKASLRLAPAWILNRFWL